MPATICHRTDQGLAPRTSRPHAHARLLCDDYRFAFLFIPLQLGVSEGAVAARRESDTNPNEPVSINRIERGMTSAAIPLLSCGDRFLSFLQLCIRAWRADCN